MRIIYIVLLATLLGGFTITLVRVKRSFLGLSPLLGWMTGLGFFILAPLAILVLNGGYTLPPFYDTPQYFATVDLSKDIFLLPFFVIWTAVMLSCAAIYLWLPETAGDTVQTRHFELNVRKLKRIILITIGVSLLDWTAMVYLMGGLWNFLASHWAYRQEELLAQLGEKILLYGRFSQANQIVFTAAASLYSMWQIKTGKAEWRFTILVLLLLLLEIVMSGNRIFFALYGLAVLMSCWIWGRKKLILALVAIAPVLLLAFSAWAYFRHNLSKIAENVDTYSDADVGSRAVTALVDGTEGINVMLLLHMINDFGPRYDYFYGLSYTKAISTFVPRSIYPGKPDNYPVMIAKLYVPGYDTSFGTTQMGELYANFGFLSILLLPLMSLGILFLTQRLELTLDRHLLLSAILFMLLIWFARSSFADNFVTLLFALILVRVFRLEDGLCISAGMAEASRAK